MHMLSTFRSYVCSVLLSVLQRRFQRFHPVSERLALAFGIAIIGVSARILSLPGLCEALDVLLADLLELHFVGRVKTLLSRRNALLPVHAPVPSSPEPRRAIPRPPVPG